MSFCRKCGSLTDERDNFCSKCGCHILPKNDNDNSNETYIKDNISEDAKVDTLPDEVMKETGGSTVLLKTQTHKNISLWSYYLLCWKKIFDFTGRARRKEYWGFCLFHSMILGIFNYLEYDSPAIRPLHIIYFRIALIPFIAVGVRRLHDLGRSGWFEIGYHVFLLLLSASTLLNTSIIFSDVIDYIFAVKGSYIGHLLGKNPLYWVGIIYIYALKLYLIKRGNSGRNRYGDDPLEI